MKNQNYLWHPNTQMSEWNQFSKIVRGDGMWLIDEDGNIYVLFAYEVDSADFDRSFFEKIDVLSNYPHPKGWSYLSRILNEDLILNPNGIANVLAIQSETSSVWEKR